MSSILPRIGLPLISGACSRRNCSFCLAGGRSTLPRRCRAPEKSYETRVSTLDPQDLNVRLDSQEPAIIGDERQSLDGCNARIDQVGPTQRTELVRKLKLRGASQRHLRDVIR